MGTEKLAAEHTLVLPTDTTVNNAILKGDGRLALRLLERLGIADPPEPGFTEVEDLETEQTLERQRQQLAKRKEAERIFWENSMTLPEVPSAAEDTDFGARGAGG